MPLASSVPKLSTLMLSMIISGQTKGREMLRSEFAVSADLLPPRSIETIGPISTYFNNSPQYYGLSIYRGKNALN